MTHHRRQLTTDLDCHLAKISLPYQCRQTLLSHGLWNTSLNMIEIIHQHRTATKCFLSMGMTKNSKLYLYPEEAIYMMQASMLQVSMTNFEKKPNIPLALDEAYSLWFNRSLFGLKHLHVYQYLTRIGFNLIRHQSQMDISEKQEDLSSTATTTTSRMKRKRDEYETESIEAPENERQDDHYCCPIHASSDCQRLWFPKYTDDPPIPTKSYPPLIFPDRLLPVEMDWLPPDFNSKVSNVQLSIYQNNTFTPRPSYSLLRSTDLQSHKTIYQRLSSFLPPPTQSSRPSSSPPNVVFDMYIPRKHFRKTQPGAPDYHLQIKNGNDEFRFEEIFNEQQAKTLTAIVHNGDICFYSFKPFHAVETLQSK